jgi:YceI-like domain
MSNSNWWPEIEFARPDPPRPSPGHWALVADRSCAVARFRRRLRRAAVIVLDGVAGWSRIVIPGRLSTCLITVLPPPPGRGPGSAYLPATPAGSPVAVFRGRRQRITPSGQLLVEGMLTLGGVTEQVSWEVTRHILSVAADGTERLVFTAEATLDRRAFDLTRVPRGTGRAILIRMRGEFVRVDAA